jgi:hypothetical protein
MEHDISRVLVQRMCDEQVELVPFLVRIIDSLELHGGLYQNKLCEIMPESVVEEIDDWLKSHLVGAGEELRSEVLTPDGVGAGLKQLERIFAERIE